MATEGKIDPMHQFEVQPIFDGFTLFGQQISFTNSALWMFVVLGLLYVFMAGGMKRELVPGRWQVMVEGIVGFIDNLILNSIGPNGKKYTPWIFTLFMFILFSNLLGMMPFGIIPGIHPFTVTSQFTVTGLLAAISFSIVLIVGFWKHGFKFFSLFIPHGTPLPMIPLIFMVEVLSFLVRPFSLALRLFVAMIAGHILIKVFASFVIQAIDAGGASWIIALCFCASHYIVYKRCGKSSLSHFQSQFFNTELKNESRFCTSNRRWPCCHWYRRFCCRCW